MPTVGTACATRSMQQECMILFYEHLCHVNTIDIFFDSSIDPGG